jgi:hypothetical protein
MRKRRPAMLARASPAMCRGTTHLPRMLCLRWPFQGPGVRVETKPPWLPPSSSPGASAGIGRAVALEFARRGCNVALLARGTGRLESAAREARAACSTRTNAAIKCVHINPAGIIETRFPPDPPRRTSTGQSRHTV